ncbi:MAG TPA: DUF4129 domain-containing protein [Anaerolineaceae bacterium]|nr:DUF4129 domain-containing protein [Anaerolineaceae bacterium]
MNRSSAFKTIDFRVVPLRVWIELGVISLLGMESLWLASYYRNLSQIELGFGPVALFLFGIGLASHYLARGLNRLASRPGIARLILLAWLVASMLLALKLMIFPGQAVSLGELAGSPVVAFLTEGRDAREFWTLVFALGVVLRGIGLARRSAEHASILFSFQVGLFMLFLFGWLVAPELRAQAMFSLVWTIFLGLVAVFSYKMVSRITDFGNQAAALDTWWARNMLVTALLLSFGGAAAGWLLYLLAPHLMQAVWALIKLVVGFVALAIVGVVQVIANIIMELLRATNLDEVASNLFNRIQQFSQQVSAWSDENMRATGDPVNVAMWIAVAAVVLAVVLFFIVRRWRAAAARSAASGREDWSQVLQNRPERPAQFGARRAPRRMQAAERVRFIYTQLMDMCEKLESPRAAAVTPLEFLPVLEELFPENKGDAETITRAYLRVRYGEFPEEKEDLRQVVRAWEELSREGEKLYHARRQFNRFNKG